VDAHTFINKAKNFKQALSVIKLMANVFWDGRSGNGEIHATRGHRNVKVFCKALKKSVWPFRTKGVEC
jgi:hypothetical protein